MGTYTDDQIATLKALKSGIKEKLRENNWGCEDVSASSGFCLGIFTKRYHNLISIGASFRSDDRLRLEVIFEVNLLCEPEKTHSPFIDENFHLNPQIKALQKDLYENHGFYAGHDQWISIEVPPKIYKISSEDLVKEIIADTMLILEKLDPHVSFAAKKGKIA